MMVTLINHVVARAGSKLREPLEIWRFLRHLSALYRQRPKKVLATERGALGTLPYGKYGVGFCITLIKKLDKNLK